MAIIADGTCCQSIIDRQLEHRLDRARAQYPLALVGGWYRYKIPLDISRAVWRFTASGWRQAVEHKDKGEQERRVIAKI
jgi:hypothetical protein